MTDNPCTCDDCPGNPLRDNQTICDSCANNLNRALGDIPWYTEELDITSARASGIDYRTWSQGDGTDLPLVVHIGAMEARTNLHAILTSWVLFCRDEHLPHQSPNNSLPADNPAAMSRWLMWRLDALTRHELGPDAHNEITAAVRRCTRAIDRRQDRQYLGACTNPECGAGSLYVRGNHRNAGCDLCGYEYEAAAIRDQVLAELMDRICTGAEIARLSTFLGLNLEREKVRKRIETWNRRGRIETHGHIDGAPTFKFGDVYAALIQSTESGAASFANRLRNRLATA